MISDNLVFSNWKFNSKFRPGILSKSLPDSPYLQPVHAAQEATEQSLEQLTAHSLSWETGQSRQIEAKLEGTARYAGLLLAPAEGCGL